MGFSRRQCCGGLQCPPSGDLPDPGIEPVSCRLGALAGFLCPRQAESGRPCGDAAERPVAPGSWIPKLLTPELEALVWGPWGGSASPEPGWGWCSSGAQTDNRPCGVPGSPAERWAGGLSTFFSAALAGPCTRGPRGWRLSGSLQGRAVRSEEPSRPVSGKMEEAGAWSRDPLAPQPRAALPAPAACDGPSAPGRQPPRKAGQEGLGAESGASALSPRQLCVRHKGLKLPKSLLPPLWGSGSWDRGAGKGL